jgi:peptide deformylase
MVRDKGVACREIARNAGQEHPMILEVLEFPNPHLRDLAEPIGEKEVTEKTRGLAHDMLETMHHRPGIGLAAVQVGVDRRLIVMDVDWGKNRERKPRILLNPEIIRAEGKAVSRDEGCLSVPDYTADVERHAHVIVRARTLEWQQLEFEAVELEAFCLQHEIDHLDGVLFIDRISRLKRHLYVRRRKKQLRRDCRATGRSTWPVRRDRGHSG